MQRRSFLRVIGAAASALMLPLSALGGVTPTGGVLSSTPAAVPAMVGSFVPEFWAKESLAVLQENMVLSKLIHRDFQDKLDSGQKYDRVNVDKGICYSTWRKA